MWHHIHPQMTLYFTSTPHYNKLAPCKSSAACGAASAGPPLSRGARNKTVAVLRQMPSDEVSALCCRDAPPLLFCFPARYSLGYRSGIFPSLLVMRSEPFSTISCFLTQCQQGEEGEPHEGEILPHWHECGSWRNKDRRCETVTFCPVISSLVLDKNKIAKLCLCTNVLMTHQLKSGRLAGSWTQSH